jgi:hypothetical protein
MKIPMFSIPSTSSSMFELSKPFKSLQEEIRERQKMRAERTLSLAIVRVFVIGITFRLLKENAPLLEYYRGIEIQ